MVETPTPIIPDLVPKPKRGGIHPTHGVYLGRSALDSGYKQATCVPYKYAHQKRTGKAITSIEDNLIKARDSSGTLKFNENLEAAVGSATEIGKKRFVAMLKRRVVEHGQETFFHLWSTTDSPKSSPSSSSPTATSLTL